MHWKVIRKKCFTEGPAPDTLDETLPYSVPMNACLHARYKDSLWTNEHSIPQKNSDARRSDFPNTVLSEHPFHKLIHPPETIDDIDIGETAPHERDV